MWESTRLGSRIQFRRVPLCFLGSSHQIPTQYPTKFPSGFCGLCPLCARCWGNRIGSASKSLSFGALGIDLRASGRPFRLSQSRGFVGSDIRTIVGQSSDTNRTIVRQIGHVRICPIGQSKTLGFLQSGGASGKLSGLDFPLRFLTVFSIICGIKNAMKKHENAGKLPFHECCGRHGGSIATMMEFHTQRLQSTPV